MSPPLPDLFEALLDKDALDTLMTDLASHAEVFEVLAKASPGARASKASLSLREAQEMLLAREVRAVQIHYRHEGTEWRDTLMSSPGGVRLVRMALPPVSNPEQP